VKTEDIYRDRFFLFLPFSDSLEETWPLAKFIKQNITDDMIKSVADVARNEHRKLLVASVDLRSGELVIWDLTFIAKKAQDNPAYNDFYRGVLRASAAIPLFFPPVRIGGDLQVDGGTGALVFYKGGLVHHLKKIKAHFSKSANGIATTGPAEADRIRNMNLNLYTIVNGRLDPDTDATNDWIVSVGVRALNCVTRASNLSSLQLVQAKAQPDYNCHLAYIPSCVLPLTDSSKFVPAEMSKLFDQGRKFGMQYGSENKDKWMDLHDGN